MCTSDAIYMKRTREEGGHSKHYERTLFSFPSYDARGNRLTRSRGIEPDTYRYDPENRLIQLDYRNSHAAPGTYHYAYDYRSRRVLRDKQRIVFSGGTSVQEYSAGGDSNARANQ